MAGALTPPTAADARWQDEAARIARGIRRRVLEHTIRNNGGYLSQACSAAEILSVLYRRAMRLGHSIAPHSPLPFVGAPGPGHPALTGAGYNGPKAPELDRFVFSPVHYALVLYAALIETGRLAPAGLDHFNRDGSTVELIGAEHSPGHEVTAGSLGQAISQAGGIALARKLRAEPGRVFLFLSDGEFQEGQTWEAINAAGHYELDNLIIYADCNGQQCDGRLEGVMQIEPLAERLTSFGAEAIEIDGHDIDALAGAGAKPPLGKPRVVICRTDPCRGLPILRERAPKLHYVRFKNAAEQARYAAALTALSAEVE
jgi:transketolase